MERRELIKLVTMATGAVLAVPLSSTVLTSCQKAMTDTVSNYELKFFSQEDFVSLQEMLDIIIPKTDSPSANDVGVHKVMDMIIGEVYKKDQKEEFSENFKALQSFIQDGDSSEKLKSLVVSENTDDEKAKQGLIQVKQQAVAYYLTSEVIAKEFLNYLPVPGVYEPCISVESVNGKAWAL